MNTLRYVILGMGLVYLAACGDPRATNLMPLGASPEEVQAQLLAAEKALASDAGCTMSADDFPCTTQTQSSQLEIRQRLLDRYVALSNEALATPLTSSNRTLISAKRRRALLERKLLQVGRTQMNEEYRQALEAVELQRCAVLDDAVRCDPRDAQEAATIAQSLDQLSALSTQILGNQPFTRATQAEATRVRQMAGRAP